MRVALVGCGAIGSAVVSAIAAGRAPELTLVGVADRSGGAMAREAAASARCELVTDATDLLPFDPELVVEVASHQAVRTVAEPIMSAGIDLMVVSVGALLESRLLSRLVELSERHGGKLYVPSGALGALDVLSAASLGGLEEVRLTTRKPPRAFSDAPYVQDAGLNLSTMTIATVLFEGCALEAVRAFPENVNVAAAVSLAGVGPDRTMVRIIADPEVQRNCHELYFRGAFGDATLQLSNRPLLTTPKSSQLVALSVLATLRRLARPFQIGG